MAEPAVVARVNCPEKIVIILDPSKEMGETYFKADETNLRSNFSWIKTSLKKFLLTKSILNKKHQFALTLLQPDGLFWYQELTSDIQLILDCLNDTEPVDEDLADVKEISMDPVFRDLSKHFASSGGDADHQLIPKYIIRTIFIYGRSHCQLVLSEDGHQAVKSLQQSQRFVFDALYLRSPAFDRTEVDVLSSLQQLNNQDTGYILEVCENLAQLFENMARLLGHPLQRCLQHSASYTLQIDETSSQHSIENIVSV